MRSYARFNRGLVDQYYKWMIAMHYAKVTKRVYLKALHQYLNFMGERSLARADHTDIRLFIADASENGATLDAVYRNLGILRQFYDFLNLGGVVDYVAPRFVRLRRPWRGRPGTLTEAQIKRLISVTQTPRERALVEFFYSSGCRLSEALHLKIENVDLVARQARVRGKLGKVRLVLLAESAAQAVRAYIGERDSGYLFEADYRPQKGHLGGYDGQWKSKWIQLRKRDGKSAQQTKILGSIARMSYEEAKQKHEALMATRNLSLPKRTRPLSKVVVQHLVASIARRAGLRNFTPHTFRRTFATHRHENGANLEVIRALLGHVWIQTTLHYARIGPDGLSKNFENCHPLGNRHEITSNSRHFDPTNTSDYEPYFLRRAREECAAATLVPAAASCFRYPWAGSHRLPTKDAERF